MPEKPNNLFDDFPQPLHVKMDETPHETPQWARFVWKSLLAFTAILLVLMTVFLQGVNSTVTEDDVISVTLDFYRLTSLRDPWPVTVTIRNESSEALDATVLLSPSPGGFLALSEAGSDTISIESLPPNGTYTHIFTFLPLRRPSDGRLRFTADVELSNSQNLSLTTENWYVNILPIPWLHTLVFDWALAGLKGSSILGLLFVFAWERLKKGIGA